MTRSGRIILLLAITIPVIIIVCNLRPIHQNLSYHSFADTRTFAGIPNFWNVITNLPFIIIGVYGFALVNDIKYHRLIYSMLLIGIVLTGFGSGYYHLHPNNQTLVYDRIPMTIVFMSFLSLTIAQCIKEQWGRVLLLPFIFIGIGSVLWWHYSDDLRVYGFVQFYPVLFVPLIYLLFPSNENRQSWRILKWVIVWYIVAKLFEHFDKEIFRLTHFSSGHSLKHLAASVSCYYLIKMLQRREDAKKDLRAFAS
jgi:hypothetical protein